MSDTAREHRHPHPQLPLPTSNSTSRGTRARTPRHWSSTTVCGLWSSSTLCRNLRLREQLLEHVRHDSAGQKVGRLDRRVDSQQQRY